MSEKPEAKITSSEHQGRDSPRVKDPKRVEAGRRLGAISKAAKEKKARERYDREAALARERSDDASGMDREAAWTTPLAVLGVAGLIGLCYVFHCKRQPQSNGDHQDVSALGAPQDIGSDRPSGHRPAPKFESFD